MRSPPNPAPNSSFVGYPWNPRPLQWPGPRSLSIDFPVQNDAPELLDIRRGFVPLGRCSNLPENLAPEGSDPVVRVPEATQGGGFCWQSGLDKEVYAGKHGKDEVTELYHWNKTELGEVDIRKSMENPVFVNDFGQSAMPGTMIMSGGECSSCSSFPPNLEYQVSPGSRTLLEESLIHKLGPPHCVTGSPCRDNFESSCWSYSPLRDQLSHGNNMSAAGTRLNSVCSSNSAVEALSAGAFHPVPLMESEYLESLQMPSTEDISWLNSLPELCTSLQSLDEFGCHATISDACPVEALEVGAYDIKRSPLLESQLPDAVSVRAEKRPLTNLSDDTEIETAAKKPKEGRETSIPFTFKATGKDEALYDGYRWQKYGKKSVKDSPYPRNYYKCLHKDCPARKQVQNSSADPGMVLTTYEGVHNHERPGAAAFGIIVRSSTL